MSFLSSTVCPIQAIRLRVSLHISCKTTKSHQHGVYKKHLSQFSETFKATIPIVSFFCHKNREKFTSLEKYKNPYHHNINQVSLKFILTIQLFGMIIMVQPIIYIGILSCIRYKFLNRKYLGLMAWPINNIMSRSCIGKPFCLTIIF